MRLRLRRRYDHLVNFPGSAHPTDMIAAPTPPKSSEGDIRPATADRGERWLRLSGFAGPWWRWTPLLRISCPVQQQLPFLRILCERRGPLKLGPGFVKSADPDQQVSPHCRQ